MHRTTGAGWLVAAAFLGVITAACAGGPAPSQTAGPTPTAPTGSPAPQTTSAPTAAPTPAAVSAPPVTPSPPPPTWGDVTLVHGAETCMAGNLNMPTPDASGVLHVRNATIRCEMEFNDPRVNGIKTGPFEFDGWGQLANGAMVQWGNARTITNDGGTWEGWFTGVYTSAEGDMITAWYRGTGAYKGLTFYEWIEGKGPVYLVTGVIFPGEPPLVAPRKL